MLPTKVRYLLFLFLLSIVFQFTIPPSLYGAPVAPDRKVVIEQTKNQSRPPWKRLWDEARELSRKQKFEEASEKYNILLQLKPNIEEAKWEYSKILIETKRWVQAASYLDTLMENDPARKDYQVYAGRVALKRKNYHQAIKLFGLVYESDPHGKAGRESLEGLIEGLEGEGKLENALLMLEQLYQRVGDEKEVLVRLAHLSQRLAKISKAKFYYSKLIKHHKIDDETLYRAASFFENTNDSRTALTLFERYLKTNPNYLPFRKKCARYYQAAGDKKAALPHLIHLYQLEGGDRTRLLQIGKIYLYDMKRPDKALYYLEEYQRKYPGDRKIKEEIGHVYTILANNFISIVENGRAKELWKDLAQITPNREAVYMAMADLFANFKRDKEELEVLEIMHNHNKRDHTTTRRIADLYKKRGNNKRALTYYRLLKGLENQEPGYLKNLAQVLLELQDEPGALDCYLRYLDATPGDRRIRERALELAGQLGLVQELQNVFRGSGLRRPQNETFSSMDRLYIEGLRNSGLFTEADVHYKRLLKQIDPRSSAGIKIRFHRIETLLLRNHIYQAEQQAREILADNQEVITALEKLIGIAISDKQVNWAKSWFDLLAQKQQVAYNSVEYNRWPAKLFFLYVDILAAERNYDEAIDRVKEYLALLRKDKNKSNAYVQKAYLTLLQLYFHNKEFEKCNRLAEKVEEKHPGNIEVAVFKKILKKNGPQGGASPPSGVSFSDLILHAELERKYNALKHARRTVDKALGQVPRSTRAALLKARILSDDGEYHRAKNIIQSLQKKTPEEEFFELQNLQLDYLQGNFSKIVQALPLLEDTTNKDSQKNSAEVSRGHRINKRLILARSLWADKQWEAAIKVYNSLLKTPVQVELDKKIDGKKVNYHLPPMEKSFWNVITFTHPEQPDPVSTIMKPTFVGRNIGKPIDQVSAGLYDKFRWQKLIESELAVRKAMKRRDYHEVEKEYQTLVSKGGSQDTLFDLAEVYGRLELYGKEAELYKEIRERGPVYPELKELERLNKLKRKPRILATTEFSTRKGRERYVDIKKKVGGAEGWFMPTLRQELHFSYFRSFYSTTERDDGLWSHRLKGDYSSALGDRFDFNVGLGVEDITESEETTILYDVAVNGKLHEKVTGRLHVYQDIVDDTLEALERGVKQANIEGGITLDVVPRWFCGADLLYRDYSDNNQQNMVRLWTSYNLFGESYLLRLKYKYENTTSSTPNLGREEAPNGFFTEDDHPYWSPSEYWTHKLMFHFKHLFPLGKSEDDILSNYTIDYSFGYESGSNVTQDASFQIFLEMSRHFLLKGNFTYESARDNKETGVNLSLIYRW